MGISTAISRAPEPIKITLSGVGKKYNREWIFRNVDQTFSSGQIYAVTGPNGAGKSTFLNVIWGQSPPSIGTITYQGRTNPVPVEDIYKRLAIAAPYMDLVEEFTLAEHLAFHFSMKPARDGLKADEMLERMYLQDARNKQIANFSSGMKQRVKLALAFFTDADVLFLDEPGTNLDRKAFDWYLHQLAELDSRCLVFIASNHEAEYPLKAEKIDLMRYK